MVLSMPNCEHRLKSEEVKHYRDVLGSFEVVGMLRHDMKARANSDGIAPPLGESTVAFVKYGMLAITPPTHISDLCRETGCEARA